MDLVPMAREETPSLGMPEPVAISPYPYGLRINLTHEELEKLGYSDLPPAGTKCRIEAVGVVTRAATEDPDADGDVDYCCVEIQITELGMEEEGEPEGEDRSAGRAERMYAKGKQD
jgi:hypothetical protein